MHTAAITLFGRRSQSLKSVAEDLILYQLKGSPVSR
jgi:hypothetical protein